MQDARRSLEFFVRGRARRVCLTLQPTAWVSNLTSALSTALRLYLIIRPEIFM